MAAVRCAARRLSASLLQRTQAAVAEGRRHLPSRFTGSRQLSSECEREIEEKRVELRNLVSKTMQKKMELQDALAKAGKNPNAIGEYEMHVLEHLSQQKIFPEPHDTPLYRSWKQFATRARSVLDIVVMTTGSVMLTACLVSIITDKEVKAHTVNKEIQ
ncbi:hypothetical protein CFC21_112339 [Triticum aestivum]|uniref:Uncharacterized protein n=2 Tax=Triticum aestivum TaxID=4565 RepID=A0A3B6TYC7_WHEAT|nr:uncharacterized protein LOC119313742 [Triticum dicoccoides]XP_037444844.1 uncharacterized protein LOC119313742 [Triticum dicoccoides]XP_044401038.1 uncharacterized protein LOC123124500 isoform X1 [Triticum aestivum]XP_044401039.1 uncharacterized protein LOC123124500 isoform X1 [Triticum aestivum]MBC2899507.1 hypothetical protein [Triticum aestivum]